MEHYVNQSYATMSWEGKSSLFDGLVNIVDIWEGAIDFPSPLFVYTVSLCPTVAVYPIIPFHHHESGNNTGIVDPWTSLH